MIEIGYKEIGSFDFSIESKNMLIDQSLRIQIGVFNENFLIFLKRGENRVIQGKYGSLSYHMVNGYNVSFSYKFENEFSHGNDEVVITVNGIDVQKVKVNFYKNKGEANVSQSGDKLTAVIVGTATDIRVNGEKVYYYKRGNLTFAKYDFVSQNEITYKKDGKLYVYSIEIEDNKLGSELSNMVVGSNTFTASLFTGLNIDKTYTFVNDGEFYSLSSRYNNAKQIQSMKRIYPIDGVVKLIPKEKINHYAVYRNDKYNPLTLMCK